MILLEPQFYRSPNIFTLEELAKRVPDLKKDGKTIGLCTGSFDLLHPGHITHLYSAKNLCDILLVGVANNSFSSRKATHGRPIFPDYARAYMIAQLKPVNFVFIEDGTPRHLELLKPDYFIKGPDYIDSQDDLMRAQEKMLSTWNGKIVCTRDEKVSTTEIISYIKERV
jgi:cytidyltransferase-like protein